MKKTLVSMIILTVMLCGVLFILTGCGNSENTSEGNETQGGQNNNQSAVESLLDWMKSKKFSLEFTQQIVDAEGKTETLSGTWAMDGANAVMIMETAEEKVRIIEKDGVMYMIDDANKAIVTLPANQGGAMSTNFTDMAKTGSGTGTVDGKTLSYEEYTIDGEKVKFYIENGQVYAMESVEDGAESVMIIKNAKKTVPAEAFDLPTGYTEY